MCARLRLKRLRIVRVGLLLESVRDSRFHNFLNQCGGQRLAWLESNRAFAGFVFLKIRFEGTQR